jgi:hypothetical protein
LLRPMRSAVQPLHGSQHASLLALALTPRKIGRPCVTN